MSMGTVNMVLIDQQSTDNRWNASERLLTVIMPGSSAHLAIYHIRSRKGAEVATGRAEINWSDK